MQFWITSSKDLAQKHFITTNNKFVGVIAQFIVIFFNVDKELITILNKNLKYITFQFCVLKTEE